MLTKLREEYYSSHFKQHEFIAAKRQTTICGKGDTILSRKKKLIGEIKSCRTCEHPCHLKKNEKNLCLEMSKYKMQDVLREGTFFSRSKVAIAQILKLIYLWSHEMATVKNIRRECTINSAHNLTDWASCVLSAYSNSFRYRPRKDRESSALSRSHRCISTSFLRSLKFTDYADLQKLLPKNKGG